LTLSIRQNSKTEFKNIFEETRIIAVKMDVDMRIPRVTKTQCNRANALPQSTDLSEFYHVNYFLPYLYYLMSELNSRFNENNNSVISNLKLIIYYFAYETSDDKKLNAVQTNEADLPHSIETLRGELKINDKCIATR